MTTLVNSFEGGTSGTAITGGPGNSGGGSGSAFDAVNTSGTGASLTFDNAHAAHGGLSGNITLPSSVAATSYLSWTTSMGAQTTVWFRMYLYHTANPSVNTRIWQSDISGSTLCAGVYLMTNGTLLFVNSAVANIVQTTNSVPLNQWYRIEGFCTGSATAGQVEIKLFSTADSATATETQTSNTSQNTGGSQNSYRFGCFAATTETSAFTFWTDDVGLSSTGYLGPSPTFTDLILNASEAPSPNLAVDPVGASLAVLLSPPSRLISVRGAPVTVAAGLASATGTALQPATTKSATDLILAQAQPPVPGLQLQGTGASIPLFSAQPRTQLLTPPAHPQSWIFYPGWLQQATYSPYVPPTGAGSPDYTAYTQVNHFGCYPNSTGGVVFTDIHTGMQAATISAAHNAGLKCILTIGSAGFGSEFAASAGATYLSTFITSIISACTTYGYDGINIDWEESVTQTPYVNLLSGLRAQMPSGLQLTADVDTGQHSAAIVAASAPYVDFFCCMTYFDNGTSTISTYETGGVPASQLLLGIGLYSTYYDTTQALVQAKCDYARNNALPGVHSWSMEWLSTDTTDARLIPLRRLVAQQPSSVTANAGLAAATGTAQAARVSPLTLYNSFEGGVPGATVSTANSGAPPLGWAFDSVAIPQGSSLTYDPTLSAHGGVSVKVFDDSTTALVYGSWTSLGAVGQAWFRLYLFFTAIPSTFPYVFAFETAGGALNAALFVRNNGKLEFIDSAFAVNVQTAGAIPLNQWFRVEGTVTANASTGQMTISLYRDMDSTVAAETVSSSATANTGASISRALFGAALASSTSPTTWWMDDIGASASGPLGPAVQPGAGYIVVPGAPAPGLSVVAAGASLATPLSQAPGRLVVKPAAAVVTVSAATATAAATAQAPGIFAQSASDLVLNAGEYSPDSVLTAMGGSLATPLSPPSRVIAGLQQQGAPAAGIARAAATALSPSVQALSVPSLVLAPGAAVPGSITRPAGASLAPATSPPGHLVPVAPATPPAGLAHAAGTALSPSIKPQSVTYLILTGGQFSTDSGSIVPDSVVQAVGASLTAPLSAIPRIIPSPPAAVTSPALITWGFGTFPQVPAGSLILSVVANVTWHGSDTQIGAPRYELWDGTSAVISTTTGNASTSASYVDIVVFTGVHYSQLATLQLRMYATSALGNSGATVSVDAVDLAIVWAPNVNAAITPAVLAVVPQFPPPLASASSTASPAVIARVPSLPAIRDITAPGYATNDSGAGWTNPGNVTGPPDGSYATWTVP